MCVLVNTKEDLFIDCCDIVLLLFYVTYRRIVKYNTYFWMILYIIRSKLCSGQCFVLKPIGFHNSYTDVLVLIIMDPMFINDKCSWHYAVSSHAKSFSCYAIVWFTTLTCYIDPPPSFVYLHLSWNSPLHSAVLSVNTLKYYYLSWADIEIQTGYSSLFRELLTLGPMDGLLQCWRGDNKFLWNLSSPS